MGNAFCELVECEIDRTRLIDLVRNPSAGAIVHFDGVVRDNSEGRPVRYLEYECYPEMALLEMNRIAESALQEFPIVAIAIFHRTGRLNIGDSSVQICVSSAHRGDAFRACMRAIDTLKKTVPIWKKEYYNDGQCWIEGPSTTKDQS